MQKLNEGDIMTKQAKKMLEDVVLTLVAITILICGCISIDIGYIGKGIFGIMCSLYMIMWVHAGLIGTIIVNKFEEIRKQEQFAKDGKNQSQPSRN